MANNDNLRGREYKQEQCGGKITTKRNTQEAPKPYDRPISTFGRIFAAVKDILKPALVTEAMSRVHDVQKDEEKRRGIDNNACDTGYEILCDSSEPDQVLVELDGYHAVFPSRVLHDEMTQPKGKLMEAVSSSEQSCEQQMNSRQNALELSLRTLDSCTSSSPVAYQNRSSLPFCQVSYHASGTSRSNDVPRTPGNDTVIATKRNVALQGTIKSSSMNGELTATPSKFESTNGAPSSSYRRFGAESNVAKPGFKMSRFCESIEKIRAGTSLLSRSRAEMAALSESCVESSFYAGRTSFGGAASAYKMNPKTAVSTSPYQTRPVVQKCVQVSRCGGETKVMSVTAQRILDTMERNDESSLNRSYDASICNSPLSFTPSYRRNSSQFGKTHSGISTRQGGPPVKQLMTPSVSVLKPTRATIIEPRDHYQDLHQALSVERKDIASLRETGYTLPVGNTQLAGFENVNSSAIGGKSKKPPKHYVSRLTDVEQSESVLSFVQPLSSVNIFPGSFEINVAANNAVKFLFSMPKEPVIVEAFGDTNETAIGAQKSKRSQGEFVFSPPRIVHEMPENDTTRSECVESTLRNVSRATSGAVNATSERTNVGGMSSGVPLTALFKKPSNVWTCSECLVDNKCTDTVCVACNTPRPAVGAPKDKNNLPVSQNTVGTASGFTLGATGGFKFGTGSISNIGFGAGFVSGAQKSDSNFSSNNSGVSTLSGGFRVSGSFDGDIRIAQKEVDLDNLGDLTRPPLRSDVMKKMEQKISITTKESVTDKTTGLSVATDKPLSELFKKPTNVWTCNECYIVNKNEQDRCISCETSKPGTSSRPLTSFGCKASTDVPSTVTKPTGNSVSSNAKPLSELFKKPADSWTCAECFVLNKSVQTTCLSCDTVKPGSAVLNTSQPATSVNSISPSKPLSELFKKPVDVWTCNECFVTNKNDRTMCQSCETAMPRATQPPILPSAGQTISSDARPLSELFKKPVDVWTCNECLVVNKNDCARCQSCETAKPCTQLPPSVPSVPSQVFSSGAKPLSELFKKPVDVWTCGECFVTNKNDHTSCQSCETTRPGTSVPVQPKISTFGAQNQSMFGSSTGQVGSTLNVSSTFSGPSTRQFQFGQLPTEAKASTENTATRSFQFSQALPVPNDPVTGKLQPSIADTKTPTFGFSQQPLGATMFNLSTSAVSVSSCNTSGFRTGFGTNVAVPPFGNSSSSTPSAVASFGSTPATSSTFASSAALPVFSAQAAPANPFVFSAPMPMFSSALSSSTAPVFHVNKEALTGFGASASAMPAFGASTGSNATVTPQFGAFPASFIPPARAGSIFGSTSTSSIPPTGFAAPSFNNPQSSSTAIDATKTSSAATTFMFGSGDGQSTSTLFTFGRQATGNLNTGSSVGSGESLVNNPGKRLINESMNGDTTSAKHAVGNFLFGASTSLSESIAFGQFQTTAAQAAADSSVPQGFSSSTPMFNIPSASAARVTPTSAFQFGSGEPKQPSFQNPFDVGSSSSVGSISNRVIKKAERRLGKPRR